MKNTRTELCPGQMSLCWYLDASPYSDRADLSQKDSRPVLLPRLDKFYKAYQDTGIRDDGSVTSKDFQSFSKKFRNVLKELAESIHAELVSYSTGHYFVSGFMKRNELFCYFSMDVPRGENPINFDRDVILYRLAESEKDYTGKGNHFCKLKDLQKCMDQIMSVR